MKNWYNVLIVISGITITAIFCCLALLLNVHPKTTQEKVLVIPQIVSEVDADNDGIDDYADIVAGARSQIGVTTSYDTSYYGDGGYPSEETGACADVIWRSFQHAGYDIRELIEEDIQQNPNAYLNGNLTDANINFRRTQNLKIFFETNATSLTTEVIPWDEENLSEWQGGDIVTFAQIPGGLWHIAIVSDKRRSDGVPYLIHNYGSGVLESDYLINWPTEITGHFRWIMK